MGRGPAEPGRARRRTARIDELLASGKAYPDPAGAEVIREWRGAREGAGYRGTPSEAEGAACGCVAPTRARPWSRTRSAARSVSRTGSRTTS